MSRYHQGKYKPKNPSKYVGEDLPVYRSGWERSAFNWLDMNNEVKWWSSETVVIPYICETDGKQHRYFMDLIFETTSGTKYLIEIKPKAQTLPPQQKKRKTQRYINEVMTYAKNQSKWKYAEEFAKKNGFVFYVWTEDVLKKLGIKIV